jgi:hypothetical protein
MRIAKLFSLPYQVRGHSFAIRNSHFAALHGDSRSTLHPLSDRW